ncbi:MAG: glycoside hydrolase family 15 protein [Actinobacteria bacterium]|nr:glycoside hydrolase family 15 protein [Actinomycetota bacterium]
MNQRGRRPAIEDYGFLSDCQAPALVSKDGSVDWWCPPRVDAPPVFGRLLDDAAGHWSLAVDGTTSVERRYLPDSLVMERTLTCPSGTVVVREAIAFEPGAEGHEVGLRSPHALVREVEVVRGAAMLRSEFAPRFEFGLTTPHLYADGPAFVAETAVGRLRLDATVPLQATDAMVTAEVAMQQGERVTFCATYADKGRPVEAVDLRDAVEQTRQSWASWAELHPGYDGDHAEVARRSALVLQGLTYQPTGAVMAAATTSLPAAFGGESNWDYRYAWLRDLSLTAKALWIAACPDEAARYLRFLADASGRATAGARVQIMYSVDGRRDLTEHTLGHLRGYRDSQPVRVGNAAWDQDQLDVMGEVLDLAFRFAEQLAPLEDRTREMLCWLADEAASTWESPDAGMWEARDRQRHYLTSKVMCWVALDRAVKVAPMLGDGAAVGHWETVRDEIRAAVLDQGWNDDVGAFTGAFGSDRLDASVLILPLVDFLPADDERMLATIDAVQRQLVRDGLVFRWDGDTNGFVLCTYWLVECLALTGRIDEARLLFDQLTARSNDLGLFAEQIEPDSGAHAGNFPQAFSHVGLINAAWRLATIDD